MKACLKLRAFLYVDGGGDTCKFLSLWLTVNLARRQAIVSRLNKSLLWISFAQIKRHLNKKFCVAEPLFDNFSEEELFIYAVLASQHDDPIAPLFHFWIRIIRKATGNSGRKKNLPHLIQLANILQQK